MTTLQHLTLTRLRREHHAQLRLVQLDRPVRRPIPTRLYVLAYAVGLAVVIAMVLR